MTKVQYQLIKSTRTDSKSHNWMAWLSHSPSFLISLMNPSSPTLVVLQWIVQESAVLISNVGSGVCVTSFTKHMICGAYISKGPKQAVCSMVAEFVTADYNKLPHIDMSGMRKQWCAVGCLLSVHLRDNRLGVCNPNGVVSFTPMRVLKENVNKQMTFTTYDINGSVI